MRFHLGVFTALAIMLAGPARAAGLDAAAVNGAAFSPALAATSRAAARPVPALIKAEVLVDRAGYSPGEIDGHPGDNFSKALAAYQADHGLAGNGTLDQPTWDSLAASSNEPEIIDYELTRQDVQGPFTRRIPSKMEAMARLPRMGYSSPAEAMAEKFHMSPGLLKALNPRESYRKAGAHILVVSVPVTQFKRVKPGENQVTRIEVDKDKLIVRAFDASGKLVGFYPASVGSDEKPAPSGTLQVERVSYRPDYTYNPKYNFKGVKAKKPFTIAPGPNNPVGIVWIALSGEGYGIHGTPEPGKISKRYSHGCVRLTNWDALRLASMVAEGVQVDFIGSDPAQAAK